MILLRIWTRLQLFVQFPAHLHTHGIILCLILNYGQRLKSSLGVFYCTHTCVCVCACVCVCVCVCVFVYACVSVCVFRCSVGSVQEMLSSAAGVRGQSLIQEARGHHSRYMEGLLMLQNSIRSEHHESNRLLHVFQSL